MKNFFSTSKKHLVSLIAPIAILLILIVVPVSHAADVIPDNGKNVAVADTQPPSDVENVKGTGGDGVIDLTWNVATDNIGVKGYKLYYGLQSVNTDGASYTEGPVDVGNKISYQMKNLTNGKKYFFALTAYDAAGNESENYSVEASATPQSSKPAADTEAPKVAKALALFKNQVKVTFSEAVKLPATHPESAFTIKNDKTKVQLVVKGAVMDDKDLTNKTVLLTTADQQKAAAYVLTAGISIKDTAGNPIVSGTSDTAAFTGTDLQPVVAAEHPAASQKSGPQIVSVMVKDNTHLDVVFSEPVTLKSDARENFIITEQQNVENTLDVTKVELDSAKTTTTLTTAPQKDMKYNLIVVDVTNKDGVSIDLENNATEFAGMTDTSATPSPEPTTPPDATTPPDTTPPEDVTNLMAQMVKNLVVTLGWTSSADTSGDLAHYVLYMSTDGKKYGKGIDVSPTATDFDVTNVKPKVKYYFKVTAKDKTGNESKGAITTFVLPATGPEMGFLLLGSLAGGKFLKKKKAKK